MTHASGLLLLLRDGPKTLGEIFHADGGRYCAEYRKTFTLLRQAGCDLRLHTIRKQGSCPGCSVMGFPAVPDCPARQRGEACYKLHAEPPVLTPDGQLVLAGMG